METFIRVKNYKQLEAVRHAGDFDCVISDFKSGLDTDGFVIDNYDELALLMEEKKDNGEFFLEGKNKRIFAGELLYSYNSEAIEFFRNLDLKLEFLAPQELTLKELKALEKKAAVSFVYKVYGHQLLMITNQCFRKNYLECENGHSEKSLPTGMAETPLMFKNESGIFYAVNNCTGCTNNVYNGTPTYMLDKLDEFKSEDNFDNLKILLDFTVESKDEIGKIIEDFKRSISGQNQKPKSFTRGHYYKGID